MRYAKALAAILMAALTALQLAIQDGAMSIADWATILIAAVTALLVYLVPNAQQ